MVQLILDYEPRTIVEALLLAPERRRSRCPGRAPLGQQSSLTRLPRVGRPRKIDRRRGLARWQHIFIALMAWASQPLLAPAATLQVPSTPYPTIQGAIAAAAPNDEIIVAPGTYYETIDFLGKAITLRSSGGPGVTTIDATGLSDSAVLCVTGEDSDTVMQGFTITGGTADHGGGMRNEGSSPTVTNCVFHDNDANIKGGGMYNLNSNPAITDCTFSQNHVLVMGGGMYNTESGPTITRCTFSQNISDGDGGGMRNYINSHPTITNCLFIDNFCIDEGGGIGNRKDSNPTIVNCVFVGNSAFGGGGMDNHLGQAVATGDPILTNCLFISNSSAGGSAMRNNECSPSVTNCTFAGNIGTGMYNRNGSNPILTNCIIWGNTGGSFAGASSPIVTFSDIEGGFTGTGNINTDPMFVDSANNHRLTPGSPCIDVGDNNVPYLESIDLDGQPRISNGTVDMGAYETQSDCNANGIPDHEDIANGTSADYNDNGIPDECEGCLVDSDCDDGLFCNGPETCVAQLCQPGTDPCPGQDCDEVGDTCITCDDDGTCELGEDCHGCPGDCPMGGGAVCGNGVCETADGEDCVSCPADCSGRLSGKPSQRYCCGDGSAPYGVTCDDPRCTDGGSTCTSEPGAASCCGDGTCEGLEDSYNCAIDCGEPGYCGDGTCDPDEDACDCPQDCGAPPLVETDCADGLDDDCDSSIDCADPDCAADPACACLPRGDPCAADGDCCSNKCRGGRCK